MQASDWKKINLITTSAKRIFQEIQKIDGSRQAKMECFQDLHQQLLKVKNQLMLQTIFQKCISLFTYISKDEKALHHVLKDVKKAEEKEDFQIKRLWMGKEMKKHIPSFFILNILKSVGCPFPIPYNRPELVIWNEKKRTLNGLNQMKE